MPDFSIPAKDRVDLPSLGPRSEVHTESAQCRFLSWRTRFCHAWLGGGGLLYGTFDDIPELRKKGISADRAQEVSIAACGKLGWFVQKSQKQGTGANPVFGEIDRGSQPPLLHPFQKQGRKNRFPRISRSELLDGLFDRFLDPAGVQIEVAEDEVKVRLRFLEQLGPEVFDGDFVMGPGDTETRCRFQRSGAIGVQAAQK